MLHSKNSLLDDYIGRSPQFAQPILAHLRKLVHEGCPEIEEDMVSSRPTFLHRSKGIASMVAFDSHCVFSFLMPSVNQKIAESAVLEAQLSGSLWHLKTLEDVPADEIVRAFVREAVDVVDSRLRLSYGVVIRHSLRRGALFMVGAFIMAVFFPTVIANIEYNRRLNEKRIGLAHDVIEHDAQVNALMSEMKIQLNIFWIEAHDPAIVKVTPKSVSAANAEFNKQWQRLNALAWYKYWNLLADAYATRAIKRSEYGELHKAITEWTDATAKTNESLGALEISTLYRPDLKSRTSLISAIEENRKRREALTYQIYSVIISNAEPGVWKDLRGVFGSRE